MKEWTSPPEYTQLIPNDNHVIGITEMPIIKQHCLVHVNFFKRPEDSLARSSKVMLIILSN